MLYRPTVSTTTSASDLVQSVADAGAASLALNSLTSRVSTASPTVPTVTVPDKSEEATDTASGKTPFQYKDRFSR